MSGTRSCVMPEANVTRRNLLLHSRDHDCPQRAGALRRAGARRSQGRHRLCRQHPVFGNLRVRPAAGPDFSRNHRRDARRQPDHLGDGLSGRSGAEGHHGDVPRPRPQPRGLSRRSRLLSRSRRCRCRYLGAVSGCQIIAGAVARYRGAFGGRACQSPIGGRARPRLCRARAAAEPRDQGDCGAEGRPRRRRTLRRRLRHRYADPRLLRDQVGDISADGHPRAQGRADARSACADRGVARRR